ARGCNLSFSSLLEAPGRRLTVQERQQLAWLHQGENHTAAKDLISASDAIEAIEIFCHLLVATLQKREFNAIAVQDIVQTQLSTGWTREPYQVNPPGKLAHS